MAEELFAKPEADDTVAQDAGDDTPAPTSPLDTLAAHHAASLGVVSHSEISALITAIKQMFANL